jgi:transposase-like protein
MFFNSNSCPYCGSKECKESGKYNTMQNGERKLFRCTDCGQVFSETKGTFIEKLRKPIDFVIKVLKSRSEGSSFNATCRVFEISKNTLLNWERKFADMKDVLFLYCLTNQFLSQIIEGDEVYTKINKNVPAEDSQGWTIILMERASRFIWVMDCGEHEKALFLNALEILVQVIEQTEELSLITDGERRYGKILFEICYDLLTTGKPGRPPKVLPKNVKVRIKNKGDSNRETKKPRPKYEAPCREHPETEQNISESDIHANHVEAFNGSLRRRNSAYRRKTNTYAKSKTGLQRTLDLGWIVHNFIRVHWTTKQVPAVALGIIDAGLSWMDVLKMRMPSFI